MHSARQVGHSDGFRPALPRGRSRESARSRGISRRAGTENSHSWPGFFEGAIVTGEEAAVELDALLRQGAKQAAAIEPADAWDLPRRHTQRLVTAGFVG